MQQRPKPQTEPVTVVLARGALDADSHGGGIGTGHLLAFLPLCPAVVSPGGYDEVQRRGLKPGWNPVETRARRLRQPVAGVVGEGGFDLFGKRSCLAVLIDPQCCAQASGSLIGRSGKPVNLGLGH